MENLSSTQLDDSKKRIANQDVAVGSDADIKARRQMLRNQIAARKHDKPNKAGPVQKMAYSITQACEAAGVNKDTLYSAINQGELQSLKIGRRRLIRVESLSEWLEELEAKLREENA